MIGAGCLLCDRPVFARGWCTAHYSRWHRHGDPLGGEHRVPAGICSVIECERPTSGRGWCEAHYQRWRKHGNPLGGRVTLPFPENVWAKVNKGGPIPSYAPHLGPCWLWIAGRNGSDYGRVQVAGRNRPAHRVVYELVVGPIAEGLHMDHLCRVPRCVNPAHLDPVPCRENLLRGYGRAALNARKTHCKYGHEFTVENTRLTARGARACRACEHARREAVAS